MDDTLEELIIAVRADTSAFRRDIAGLRADAEGPLADGFARASLTLERGLINAVRSGRTGFDDLKRVALAAMAEIASSALRSGLASLGGGGATSGQGQGGGLLSAITQIASAFAGAPGRATGGPVSPGRAYRVGENGPEFFVPTTSGSIAAMGGGFGGGFGGAAGGAPNITLNIRVSGEGSSAQSLHRSARHVAHAVRGVLAQ